MRELFRDSEHLWRMAGLFVIGTTLFFVARAWMIPEDFGVYGHYRAGAITDNMVHPLVHAGHEACSACHEDVVESRLGGKHAQINCETCHGARAAHAEDPAVETAPISSIEALCANCHAHDAARPSWLPQVDVADHADGEPCESCHEPHAPGFDDE